eukprot:g38678.t1
MFHGHKRRRRHKKNGSVRFIVEASAPTISDTSDNIAAASISDNIERSTISTSASGDEREHDDQELQQQEDSFHDHDIDTSDGEVEDTSMEDDDPWIASLDLDQTLERDLVPHNFQIASKGQAAPCSC